MAHSTFFALQQAAAGCKACDLWKLGKQTVFGEGDLHTLVMFIGEQPGDEEDLKGRPFVGPAGKLLNQVLEQLGLDRQRTYLTNAVKHFKWEAKGKRRVHVKPNPSEIRACFPWLKQEIDLIKPRIIVCLGATAAQALFGSGIRVTKQRGHVLQSAFAPGAQILITVHPASILRAPDSESRHLQMQLFLQDLQKIPILLAQSKDAHAPASS